VSLYQGETRLLLRLVPTSLDFQLSVAGVRWRRQAGADLPGVTVANIIGCGSVLAATLLVASCTGGDSSVSSTPSTSSGGTTSLSASRAASPTLATFTSGTYGYTLQLPALWSSILAQKKWDGKASLSSDSDEVDQFPGTYQASSWAVAAPSKQDLAAYTAAMMAANARDHGDTCPAKPETRNQIMVGDEPGTLLEYNCGILINLAAAIHHGVGYQFGFRDPTVNSATDPADHATFLNILKSVQFPD
jgi:hypothetical protein